jgi:hypothetical protein
MRSKYLAMYSAELLNEWVGNEVEGSSHIPLYGRLMTVFNLLLMRGFCSFTEVNTPVRTEAVLTQNLSRLLTDGLHDAEVLRRRKFKNVNADNGWKKTEK